MRGLRFREWANKVRLSLNDLYNNAAFKVHAGVNAVFKPRPLREAEGTLRTLKENLTMQINGSADYNATLKQIARQQKEIDGLRQQYGLKLKYGGKK